MHSGNGVCATKQGRGVIVAASLPAPLPVHCMYVVAAENTQRTVPLISCGSKWIDDSHTLIDRVPVDPLSITHRSDYCHEKYLIFAYKSNMPYDIGA